MQPAPLCVSTPVVLMASVAAIVSATQQAQPARRPGRGPATGNYDRRRTSWKPESNTTSLPFDQTASAPSERQTTNAYRPTVQARVILKKAAASGSFRSVIRAPSLCPVKRPKEVLSYDDMLTKMSSTDRVEAKKRNKDHVRRLTAVHLGNRCLILPLGSTFAICWDIWTAFWLAFTALVTPFEVAFMPDEGPTRPIFWINRVVDTTFVIDIVLQFFIICEQERHP